MLTERGRRGQTKFMARRMIELHMLRQRFPTPKTGMAQSAGMRMPSPVRQHMSLQILRAPETLVAKPADMRLFASMRQLVIS